MFCAAAPADKICSITGTFTDGLQMAAHHPVAKEVAHWTTIYGYKDSGATFSFQDPAANSSALGSDWDAVAPSFYMSATSTLSYETKQGRTRGIAW